MAKSTSTAKSLASLLILVAVLFSFSGCSLGSMPSRTSGNVASSDDSSVSGSKDPGSGQSPSDNGPTDPSGAEDENSLSYTLRSIAEEDMSILSSCDPALISETFGVRYSDVLPETYSCDDQLFTFLFSNMTYTYGAIITSDDVNYSLDVTYELPDIRACVEEILADEEIMGEVGKPWVTALANGEPPADPSDQEDSSEPIIPTDPDGAYNWMKEAILKEAMRRIEEGSYTGRIRFTDYFSFHNNGSDSWLCTRKAEIATFCSRDYYMWKLTYIDMVSEYHILERSGKLLVSSGEMKQEDLDVILEQKKEEIMNTQQG